MATDNMATAYFHGQHIHSANNLTIYIDDVKERSFDGGGSCSVRVAPGEHCIRILVYNDASETAYWLGPFSAYFEAGREYDFSPGKSDGAENCERGKEYNADSGSQKTGGGGGCLIFIIIAAVLISQTGLSVGSFVPAFFKDTNQVQVTEPAEPPSDEESTGTPSDEQLDNLDTEQSGFIFPNSDTDLIEQWEIEGLSDRDLVYAINEIYARYGYIFQNNELREYYEQFSWYSSKIPANEFSVNIFNQIEQQNWNLLVNERDSRKASG